MLSTQLTLPRTQADQALALTENIPNTSLDIAEHPTNPSNYLATFWLDDTQKDVFINNIKDIAPDQLPLVFTPVDTSIDYVALTRSQFPPLTIGQLFIARNQEPTPPGLKGLHIMPNRAFGSGEHATTTGCLVLLQQVLAQSQPSHLLDVGAGSAILALAAARLHGIPSLGTDNDPPSVDIANQNATLNGLQHLHTSVVDEDLTHPHITQKAPYPLVLANILLQPLIQLAPKLGQLTSPGGTLITSGTTANQFPQLQAALAAQGFTHQQTHQISQGDYHWQALLFTKNA